MNSLAGAPGPNLPAKVFPAPLALPFHAHAKPSRVLHEGLVPGTTYELQLRSVGGTTGYSDWSDPVSRMAT